MKKILLIAIFLSLILIPTLASALCDTSGGGIVPCGQSDSNGKIACPCTLGHVFLIFSRIYDFLVKYIATPLAVLGLVIGGVLLLLSAGNPGLAKMGKDAIIASVIGLCLAYGSYLIIKTILAAMGYVYTF